MSDVVVFHDEIELPPAKVRVKTGGGNAGHNGLRSISAHVGNDYRRVRFGVGHPGHKDLVQPYVLNDFAKSDRPWVEALLDIVADNAELLARGEDATFQNRVHLAMDAKGFVEREGPATERTDFRSARPRASGAQSLYGRAIGPRPAFAG